ncbi:MAG TPA: RsmE family RNA methyltransferase [Bacillota bacterium]|nr:RsmE family RNA methyltransferase [Bacillota bacterium]
MQRYFIDENQINEQTVIIDNSDVHHIKDVMRFKVTDNIIVNTYEGSVFETEIEKIEKNRVVLRIVKSLVNDYQSLPLDLGVSLIKKDRFELILEKTTELGVRKIIPLNTDRSIIKINDFDKKHERFMTIVKEASEQSERSVLPIISDFTNLKSLELDKYDYKLFCYARENSLNIKEELTGLKKNHNILILIGPEGDFSQTEISYLLENGFKSVSLGKTILRSETAAIYAVSLVRFLLEDQL